MVLPLTVFHVPIREQSWLQVHTLHAMRTSLHITFFCVYAIAWIYAWDIIPQKFYTPCTYVYCSHEWSDKQLTTGRSASGSYSTALLHCTWGAGSSPLPSPDVDQRCIGSECCRHFCSSYHWQQPGGLCHLSQPTGCLPPPCWPAEAATPCPFTAAEVDHSSCLHLAPASCRPIGCTASRTYRCHHYPSNNHYNC